MYCYYDNLLAEHAIALAIGSTILLPDSISFITEQINGYERIVLLILQFLLQFPTSELHPLLFQHFEWIVPCLSELIAVASREIRITIQDIYTAIINPYILMFGYIQLIRTDGLSLTGKVLSYSIDDQHICTRGYRNAIALRLKLMDH